MMEIGEIIKWKVKVYLHGLMRGNMKEIIMMIKKRDLVYFTGQMEGNTKESGRMGNNME